MTRIVRISQQEVAKVREMADQGYSDGSIGDLLGWTERRVRNARLQGGIEPGVRRNQAKPKTVAEHRSAEQARKARRFEALSRIDDVAREARVEPQLALRLMRAEGRYAALNKIAADLGITPAEVTRRWHALRSRMRGGLSVWAVIVADLD